MFQNHSSPPSSSSSSSCHSSRLFLKLPSSCSSSSCLSTEVLLINSNPPWASQSITTTCKNTSPEQFIALYTHQNQFQGAPASTSIPEPVLFKTPPQLEISLPLFGLCHRLVRHRLSPPLQTVAPSSSMELTTQSPRRSHHSPCACRHRLISAAPHRSRLTNAASVHSPPP